MTQISNYCCNLIYGGESLQHFTTLTYTIDTIKEVIDMASQQGKLLIY